MNTDSPYAPIALFVYNRPDHTRQTIEALQENPLASQSELFIFSDAPKNATSKQAVYKVRSFLKSVTGFKKVSIVERESNLGLAQSIILGVTDIVNRYGRVIVLEDDLITSSKFLQFMNDALNAYQNDERVASIHGYNYPMRSSPSHDYFIEGADCWGWATWEDQWAHFEQDGSKLLKQLYNSGKIDQFNFGGHADFSGMLKDQIAGNNNSWAIRWNASCFLKGKLTLYPQHSFVENIGLDNSGTHCEESSIYNHLVQLNESYTTFTRIEARHNTEAHKKMSRYFKRIKPTLLSRIMAKLKKLSIFTNS